MFNWVFQFGAWWTKALDFLLSNEAFWNNDNNPAVLPSVQSKEQPWSSWTQDPLLGVSVQATTSLPKHPNGGSSRTWRKTSREAAQVSPATLSGEQSRLGSSETRPEGDQRLLLFVHTKGCAWTLHQSTPFSWPVCPNHCTPSSSSQGEPCGFFFSFPPPSFLARGQPSPQNRLQDRLCRVPGSVAWLEERMKSEMKPHSFLFLTPC